jgi:hypothetical protein
MYDSHFDRFLLVIFQLKSVLRFRLPRDIKTQLENLPKTPEAAYRELLERMTPEDRALAVLILGWVLNARRLLKMSELVEVLALQNDHDGPFLDVDYCPSLDTVIQACGGLVAHDRDSDLITFSHETVRPFLETNPPASLPSHSVLCKTCLTYLRLPPFQERCHAGKKFLERMKEFRFSVYAANYWATHARQSGREIEIENEILALFKSDGRREAVEELKSDHIPVRRMKSLLQVLIENRLTFIFLEPLSSEEAFQNLYLFYPHVS